MKGLIQHHQAKETILLPIGRQELYKKKAVLEPGSGAGFTLIELLLTVALISLLAGLSVPIYQSFQIRNDLNVATDTIVQSLRRAQTLSRSVMRDSSWGLRVVTGTIDIFSGASYAARNPAYDENFDLPAVITPSGLSEVVFSKLYGLPNVTGSIMLNSTINATRTITINEKGVIDY